MSKVHESFHTVPHSVSYDQEPAIIENIAILK